MTSGNSTAGSTPIVPVPVCSGAFGEPEWLFSTEYSVPSSPAITPDERELYFVDYPDAARIVMRSVRDAPNAHFREPEAVPEFRELCPSLSPEFEVASFDLSPDGLTAYIACQEALGQPATLVSATRTGLGVPFTPDLTPLGSVGTSFSTVDGLEAFGNDSGSLDVLHRYQRSSLTARFGEAEQLPFDLRGPDPSKDGLWLFGSVPREETPLKTHQLAVATRADLSAPFADLTTEGFPVPGEDTYYTFPAISADCRSLYFVAITSTIQASVMVAER